MNDATSNPIPILETRDEWAKYFEANWLRHLNETGEADWDLYETTVNKTAPPGPGIDLSKSRLVLITSSGAYLKGEQERFDAENLYGDQSLRIFPSSTPLEELEFAQDHYDHKHRKADPQVLVPLRHLEDMMSEGIIGELAPNVISFSGYQADVRDVADAIAPAMLKAIQAEKADGALLVPS
ncbi:MAG: glycine/sarcosine/betaine reductase selenoprotein B family protein [Chloroflexi bacterium]|nr:glycine/sarcosine/betaine reductase selenoprotein B family protein [Chloroflexota bacterium]